MNIELKTFPEPFITYHFDGTVEEILAQVKFTLEELLSASPEGEKSIVLHAIPDITIVNVIK